MKLHLRNLHRVVPGLLTLVCLTSLHFAHADENNFAQWTGLMVQGKVDDQWGWYFESQTRLNDGYDLGDSPNSRLAKGNRMMIRPAIRYLPRGDGSLQFHFGYGWTPNLSPKRDESRIYQQVLWQTNTPNYWFVIRGRLEQRWIQEASGTAWRSRVFGRAQRYFDTQNIFALALWDEYFWTFNDVAKGPLSGFDQNRFFIGPHFLLNPNTRLEFGYLNNYIAAGRDTRAVSSHVYALYVYIDI